MKIIKKKIILPSAYIYLFGAQTGIFNWLLYVVYFLSPCSLDSRYTLLVVVKLEEIVVEIVVVVVVVVVVAAAAVVVVV